MPAFNSPVISVARGQSAIHTPPAPVNCSEVGIVIVQGMVPFDNYRGVLVLYRSITVPASTYSFALTAGTVWNDAQRFVFPNPIVANFFVYRHSKRASNDVGLRFYWFVP